MSGPYIRWLSSGDDADGALAGGKAASLAHLRRILAGTDARIPDGFVVDVTAFRRFLAAGPGPAVKRLLSGGELPAAVAPRIRAAIEQADLPADLHAAITSAYRELGRREGSEPLPVAIRSSAIGEDAPTTSFAGQHASFIGVLGEEAVLAAYRSCVASLYSDRATAYREAFGLAHEAAEIAVLVHSTVAWPNCSAAGVIFTLDTESGFPGVVVVSSTWGLGEAVVQGLVTPDEIGLSKVSLEREARRPVAWRRTGSKLVKLVAAGAHGEARRVATTPEEQAALSMSDAEAVRLAQWSLRVERDFGRPVDIEWARDGDNGDLCVVQARPETVFAGRGAGTVAQFVLNDHPAPLVTGVAVGSAIASGTVRVLATLAEGATFDDGDVLVTAATSPDWLPLMRRSSAVVTDSGGRTSHAAIVSRELGVPAVVGAADATRVLAGRGVVTVSCAEGPEGHVYAGAVPYETRHERSDDLAPVRTRIMMNLAMPDAAFRWWRLPAAGVGLARIEFIIDTLLRVHPMALVHPEQVDDADTRALIERLASGYDSLPDYFICGLAEGIARIAIGQHPHPVVVRFSDFKSNEYANLIGGRPFELAEANPMLGLRGASRYYHERYREAFALECAAIRMVREEMCLDNVIPMIPFCRTAGELDRVLAEMASAGLVRGQQGLRVYMMCEIPSNVVLAADFAARVDGFSIGSNDLTQLVLGVDRDSAELKALFDERDPAVLAMIRSVIGAAHAQGAVVGICGQAPSDYPEFAAFLVECGIDSISVNPDALLRTHRVVAEAEARLSIRP